MCISRSPWLGERNEWNTSGTSGTFVASLGSESNARRMSLKADGSGDLIQAPLMASAARLTASSAPSAPEDAEYQVTHQYTDIDCSKRCPQTHGKFLPRVGSKLWGLLLKPLNCEASWRLSQQPILVIYPRDFHKIYCWKFDANYTIVFMVRIPTNRTCPGWLRGLPKESSEFCREIRYFSQLGTHDRGPRSVCQQESPASKPQGSPRHCKGRALADRFPRNMSPDYQHLQIAVFHDLVRCLSAPHQHLNCFSGRPWRRLSDDVPPGSFCQEKDLSLWDI